MNVKRRREDIGKYIGKIEGMLAEAQALLAMYGSSTLAPHQGIGEMTAEVYTKREVAWLMTRLSDEIDWVTPPLQHFGDFLQTIAECTDEPQPVFEFNRFRLESDAASLRTVARKLRRMADATDTATVADLWRTSRAAHFYVLEVLKANELLQTAALTILPDESKKQED